MKCLIQIDENGNAINHPIVIDNFLSTFPNADLSGETAPPGYVWFTRKNAEEQKYSPTKTIKQVVETRYIKSADGINYEDEHYLRDMTEEELQKIYDEHESIIPFPSWTYDRELLMHVPPKPKPIFIPGYNKYEWNEETLSWKEIRIDRSNTINMLESPAGFDLLPNTSPNTP